MKADPLALEASTWPTRDVGPACRICQVALELGHRYYDEDGVDGGSVVHYSCATKEEEEQENVGGESYTAWPSDDEVAVATAKINEVLRAPIIEEKNVNQPAYPTAPPQGQPAYPQAAPQQPVPPPQQQAQPQAQAALPPAPWTNPNAPAAAPAPEADAKPKRRAATPPEKAAKIWKTVQKAIEDQPPEKLDDHKRARLLNAARGMEQLCLTFETDCLRGSELWDEIADLGMPREGLGIF